MAVLTPCPNPGLFAVVRPYRPRQNLEEHWFEEQFTITQGLNPKTPSCETSPFLQTNNNKEATNMALTGMGRRNKLRDPNYNTTYHSRLSHWAFSTLLAMSYRNSPSTSHSSRAQRVSGSGQNSPDFPALLYMIQMSMLFAGRCHPDPDHRDRTALGAETARRPGARALRSCPIMIPLVAGRVSKPCPPCSAACLSADCFHACLGYVHRQDPFALPPLVTGPLWF